MAVAKIIKKLGTISPNGREMRLQLRHGARGKGALIQSVIYWPWSDKSVEAAYNIIYAAAERAGVKIAR